LDSFNVLENGGKPQIKARVNKVTSASLGYPQSVFNKNSTPKPRYNTINESVGCELTGVETY